MATTTTTATLKTITLTMDPESFVGADGWDGIDYDATMENYAQQVIARLSVAYPSAEIEVDYRTVIKTKVELVYDTGDGLADLRVEDGDKEAIEALSDDVYQDGDFWVTL